MSEDSKRELQNGDPNPGAMDPSQLTEDSFSIELKKSLEETEKEAKKIAAQRSEGRLETWETARRLVERFQPVPWFIWRISNYVYGREGELRSIGDGFILGLKRLLFAAASDPFFSDRGAVNNIHAVLAALKPDVIAAIAVVHAICRRLATYPHERIWRPILDDALLRAQIGYFAGERNPEFGAGRGMLAGFAGRCGLAVLIATGSLDQARSSLERLASGADISEVGTVLYGCDPLQVSAMTLSASGCGTDAAYGTASYAVSRAAGLVQNRHQAHWLSAFAIVELVRMGREKEVENRFWEDLGYVLGQDKSDLIEVSKTLIRRGHSLSWIQ